MAQEFPRLHWVSSDVKKNHASLKARFKNEKIVNVHGPEAYEIGKDNFPKLKFDYVYTANTFHDMSWKEVKALLKAFKKHLRPGAMVFIYGPFKYDEILQLKATDLLMNTLKN